MESTVLKRLVLELGDINLRQRALLLLSDALRNDSKEGGNSWQDLPPMLCHSEGTIAALSEFMSLACCPVYCCPGDVDPARVECCIEAVRGFAALSEPFLDRILANSFLCLVIDSAHPDPSTPELTFEKASLVCNSLTLLKCVASHPDTKKLFINAQMHLKVYPFLPYKASESMLTEYLRLTSLGVIGALMMDDDTEVIGLLLPTDIIPLCLQTMETGSVFSKTAATFIVQRILLHEEGLDHICKTENLVSKVGQALGNMVEALTVEADKPSSLQLLNDIIVCYLLISDNPGARDALKIRLPSTLKDGTFSRLDHVDEGTKELLQELLLNVEMSGGSLSSIERLVLDLSNDSLRGYALLELSNALRNLSMRTQFLHHLPPMLCKSVGTIASLLRVIVSTYPSSSTPNHSIRDSSFACNALTLLQCVASHPDTRRLFLKVAGPLYLYPLLLCQKDESSTDKYLKLTCFGVIQDLVKDDDPDVIRFLLLPEYDIIPLCLHTMNMGSVFLKTAATFILKRILPHMEKEKRIKLHEDPTTQSWVQQLHLRSGPTPGFLNSLLTGPGAFTPIADDGLHRVTPTECLVHNLIDCDLRKNALLELSKRIESSPDLAPLLWGSGNAIESLLQVIKAGYGALSQPNLSLEVSNQVGSALKLLQCVASHPDTRMAFMEKGIHSSVYPFLNAMSQSKYIDYLRLTGLEVLKAMVKDDDYHDIKMILPCVRSMILGSVYSKTAATFILQRILLHEEGLDHICDRRDLVSEIGQALRYMVEALVEDPSSELLKNILKCYIRLSDNIRARTILQTLLPFELINCTVSSCGLEDPTTQRLQEQVEQVEQLFDLRLYGHHDMAFQASHQIFPLTDSPPCENEIKDRSVLIDT